jgi:hypothetical protein
MEKAASVCHTVVVCLDCGLYNVEFRFLMVQACALYNNWWPMLAGDCQFVSLPWSWESCWLPPRSWGGHRSFSTDIVTLIYLCSSHVCPRANAMPVFRRWIHTLLDKQRKRGVSSHAVGCFWKCVYRTLCMCTIKQICWLARGDLLGILSSFGWFKCYHSQYW